jgi:translation initiation factor 2 beta subunit (eIF-2beta)/eIF-5
VALYIQIQTKKQKFLIKNRFSPFHFQGDMTGYLLHYVIIKILRISPKNYPKRI